MRKEHYLSQFGRLKEELLGHEHSWVNALRESAMASFESLGIPDRKNESWKYTNPKKFADGNYELADRTGVGALLHSHIRPLILGDRDCHRLVFVNGRFSPSLSVIYPLPERVTVGSLSEAWEENRWENLRELLSCSTVHQTHSFAALNTAFLTDGAFVCVPEGQTLSRPIEILYVSTVEAEGSVNYPRNVFLLEPGSQASIIENYVTFNNPAYFTNSVTEASVLEGARLDHCKVVREGEFASHLGVMKVRQDGSSLFSSHAFFLKGSQIRQEVDQCFDGRGAQCTLNGLFVASHSQHIDAQTRVDHAEPDCTSRQLYKSVLDGKARGVFGGQVLVREQAQRSDAVQTSRNLVLSDEAEMDAKPHLEIYADDVKCSHGATVGQLDESAIHYLMSRGIGKREARDILIRGFAQDVIDGIEAGWVRDRVAESVMVLLPGFMEDGNT